MEIPTFTLEEKKLPRVILSVRPSPSSSGPDIFTLMKKLYQRETWFFDLPSERHLRSFRELKTLTEDENLMGLCHIPVEEGVSFSGKPVHWVESRIISTIKRSVVPSEFRRQLFPVDSPSDVFTQKEIDRIAFDTSRFDKALSPFQPDESPFLLMGGKYGDWLLGLGLIDLLKAMVAKVRERGFVPIFSGQWATFVLPKAKPLDAAAYAIPVNRKWSHFDLNRASDLIKKFDRPVMSLNPLADGELLNESEGAFSFLFNELKICGALAEIASEAETERILDAVKRFPSLIPHRKPGEKQ
jgi:hypothetical protein